MPIFRLTDEILFPDPELAEDGWLAVGGDLRPERLLLAYMHGIFPWPMGEGYELTWASPEMRLLLYPDEFRPSRRLLRTIKQGKFNVKFDMQFEQVIQHCARAPRRHEDGTWITRDIQQAYIRLHHLGFAHSVETYLDGDLVGGMYGLSLGGAFFGESMFYLVSDGSKVALHALIQKMRAWNFDFIDAQVRTEHMVSMGAREIPRHEYLKQLENTLQRNTRRGPWTFELA